MYRGLERGSIGVEWTVNRGSSVLNQLENAYVGVVDLKPMTGSNTICDSPFQHPAVPRDLLKTYLICISLSIKMLIAIAAFPTSPMQSHSLNQSQTQGRPPANAKSVVHDTDTVAPSACL